MTEVEAGFAQFCELAREHAEAEVAKLIRDEVDPTARQMLVMNQSLLVRLLVLEAENGSLRALLKQRHLHPGALMGDDSDQAPAKRRAQVVVRVDGGPAAVVVWHPAKRTWATEARLGQERPSSPRWDPVTRTWVR